VAKSPEAFRTISEASEELGVPQHVLRFWETKFSFVRPMKRAGGRRFYRPQDIAVLATVHRLLHEEGYTIKGVQKLHREHGLKRIAAAPRTAAAQAPSAHDSDQAAGNAGGQFSEAGRERLRQALATLEAAQGRIEELLRRR
jgi:DNA-binding transcriptional MerR regulator